MCLVTAGGQGSLLLSHWSIHHHLHLNRTTISSFHIWVSFRSQNPIWSHHPWTTPPFINNKSFPIYSHQKIFPYLSLSFFFFFFLPSQTRQPQLSPSTRPVPCNSDTTYVPSTWGPPDLPNPPLHSLQPPILHSLLDTPTPSTLSHSAHYTSSYIIDYHPVFQRVMLSHILNQILRLF